MSYVNARVYIHLGQLLARVLCLKIYEDLIGQCTNGSKSTIYLTSWCN